MIHTTGIPVFSVNSSAVTDISNALETLQTDFLPYTTDIILTGNTVALQKPLTTNAIQSYTYFQASDDRLKHNEQPISNALSTIMKLTPKIYDKTEVMLDANYNGNLDDYEHFTEAGLIAQDVKNIPELEFCVTGGDYTDDDGNIQPNEYAVNYQNIGIYAIKAIQELNAKIDALKEQLQNNDII